MDAFAGEAGMAKLKPLWEAECRALLAAGADVIVPAGGLPMLMFGTESGATFEGVPIVNGLAVIAKAAEMAIKLHAKGHGKVSRASNFAKPPAQALTEFLEQG
jgi:hypothetical protein